MWKCVVDCGRQVRAHNLFFFVLVLLFVTRYTAAAPYGAATGFPKYPFPTPDQLAQSWWGIPELLLPMIRLGS